MPLDSEAEKLVKKAALKNALDHGGQAQFEAVMSKLLGARPDLRTSIRSLIPDIKAHVLTINGMPPVEQKKLLEELAPGELMEKKQEQK